MSTTTTYTLIPIGTIPGKDWMPGPHVAAYVDTTSIDKQADGEGPAELGMQAHYVTGAIPAGLFHPFHAMAEDIQRENRPIMTFPRLLIVKDDPEAYVGVGHVTLTDTGTEYSVNVDIYEWLDQSVRNGVIIALDMVDTAVSRSMKEH